MIHELWLQCMHALQLEYMHVTAINIIWDHLEFIWGSFGEHLGMIRRSFEDHLEISLGLFADHLGIIRDPFGEHWRIIGGSFGYYLEITWGSLLCHLGRKVRGAKPPSKAKGFGRPSGPPTLLNRKVLISAR